LVITINNANFEAESKVYGNVSFDKIHFRPVKTEDLVFLLVLTFFPKEKRSVFLIVFIANAVVSIIDSKAVISSTQEL